MWATLVKAKTPACAWCRVATAGGPDVEVKVYAHVPTPDGLVLEEADLTGPGWTAKFEEIRGLPSVHEATILDSDPEHARIRLRVSGCPIPRAIMDSGVLPRFPFDIRAGYDQLLLIGERDAGAKFIDSLKKGGVEVQVMSTRAYHPQTGITDRQRTLMDTAIAQGYYEVPRRVTLTELARRLHIAKSTLSEALARGERHVLEEMRKPRAV